LILECKGEKKREINGEKGTGAAPICSTCGEKRGEELSTSITEGKEISIGKKRNEKSIHLNWKGKEESPSRCH